jgi:hypothetical protein
MGGQSEPGATSNGTSTELIFGFILVTNYVRKEIGFIYIYIGR